MDFDQMFDAWRTQNTSPPYDLNRDALRQALQDEQTRVRRELRDWRRGLLVSWIVGTCLAVWAGFWIAITITNGWDSIYGIASGLSLVLFALAAGAMWVSRPREPEPDFGNTLEAEVRRSLALVDSQLSVTTRWLIPMLGTASLIVGVGLFSWTVTESQDISDAPSGVGWSWFTVIFAVLIARGAYKSRHKRREAKANLEFRQRHLRDLLASLKTRE